MRQTLIARRFCPKLVRTDFDVKIVCVRSSTEDLPIDRKARANRCASDDERDHSLFFGVEPRCHGLLLFGGCAGGQMRERELEMLGGVPMTTERRLDDGVVLVARPRWL